MFPNINGLIKGCCTFFKYSYFCSEPKLITMFKTNEYFDGNVMSLAFSNNGEPATIGVMAKGEYEFGTSSVEHMTVISGSMDVKLPGSNEWYTYKPYETFIVDKNTSFKVKVDGDTAYKCLYK